MKDPAEGLDELFRQAAAVADLFAIDVYPDEAMWRITVDQATSLFAELDELRGVFVLSAELGTPRNKQDPKIQALALRYNHIWPESGGARISMDTEGGSLWLLMDLSVAALNAPRLADAICRFTQIVGAWQKIIDTHIQTPGAHPTPYIVARTDKPIS